MRTVRPTAERMEPILEAALALLRCPMVHVGRRVVTADGPFHCEVEDGNYNLDIVIGMDDLKNSTPKGIDKILWAQRCWNKLNEEERALVIALFEYDLPLDIEDPWESWMQTNEYAVPAEEPKESRIRRYMNMRW